jgi:hypothetical protein
MSSYVAIANQAAIIIGTAARLTAPGDDNSLGRAVASVWDMERQAALRDGAWNFAIRRANLAALPEKPAHGFEHQFQLPADCLRLIEVHELWRDHYQLEGRRILSDEAGPLKLRYLADIEEPTQFDPLFVNAFALRIAIAIGQRIAGSAFDEASAWEKYRAALSAARRADAMENPPIEQAEVDWVTSRFFGGGDVDMLNRGRRFT